MNILEKLKTLYLNNKHKEEARKEKERKKKQRELEKAVNYFISCTEWAAKKGRTHYTEHLWDCEYAERSHEVANILASDYGFKVRYDRRHISISGWAE